MSFRPLVSPFSPLRLLSAALAQPIAWTIDASAPEKEISPDHVGVFVEDPCYADGAGLANKDARPPAARPETTCVSVSSDFVCEAPARFLTVFRIPARR